MNGKVNKKSIFFVFSLVLCILVISLIVKSLSKYIINQKDLHVGQSIPFYFESSIADVGNDKIYNNKEWDGSSPLKINFNVKNYSNNLLKTNDNITYNVKAEVINDNGDVINDDNLELKVYNSLNEVVLEDDICMLLGSDLKEDSYQLEINPKVDKLENGKKIKVKLIITSTVPYTKEINSIINIEVNNLPSYNANLLDEKNKEYVTLNLKINKAQDIVINYDNTKLMLDKSNYIVNDVEVDKNENTNLFTIKQDMIKKCTNLEINFIKLKNDSDIILGTDIIVK